MWTRRARWWAKCTAKYCGLCAKGTRSSTSVHREVLRFVREGYEIVYIGHNGHDEAVGVVGESPEHVHLIEHAADVDRLDFPESTKLVLLSQTTLSVDETADVIAALQRRFPWIELPPSSDICYATSNRQEAVKLVAQQADCMVIVGSSGGSRGSNCRRARTSAMPRRTGRKPSNSCRSRRIAWSSSVRRTRRTRCGSWRSRTRRSARAARRTESTTPPKWTPHGSPA